MRKPLAIDLFAGLGGWTEGLLAEGWNVVGFDIERHVYGEHRYPAQLVLQDVLTIHGSQFKSADLIVASPPCQEYSYMAMPWSLAKQKQREYEDGTRDVKQLTALFDACFRIQREACESANPAIGTCEAFATCARQAISFGHFGKRVCGPCSEFGWNAYGPPVRERSYRYIPLVVENVKGAQRWVGRAPYHFGSFYLWGDVPALMPLATGTKNSGGSWFNVGSPGQKQVGRNPVHELSGVKQRGSGREWFAGEGTIGRTTSSRSPARKMASAMIAKIPLVLSRHIASVYYPVDSR